MDYQALLTLAIDAAERAAVEIMDVYMSGDFQAEVKGDNSPLTLADKRAHGVIVRALEVMALPILSEEGRDIPYEERKDWACFWMVDPLDGTKEFLKRNGEFTVNIALIEKGRPVLGVVAVPVSGDVYFATLGGGSFLKRDMHLQRLSVRVPVDQGRPGLRVVASRSHLDGNTERFVQGLNHPVLVSKGSSLKFMLLAEGSADVYPRYAPTMEWDTAAAHIIVRETGLAVRDVATFEEITYNKESLLNPSFICS